MKWLLAGTGCACTLTYVLAATLGPILAALVLVTVGAVATVAGIEATLDRARHRAELDRGIHNGHRLPPPGTVTDTTSRRQ